MFFVERKLYTWKNRRFCPEEFPLHDQVLRGMAAMATDRNF
jgi:hypothetical protein